MANMLRADGASRSGSAESGRGVWPTEGETPLPRESAEGGEEEGRGHVCRSELVPHLLAPHASHRSPPRDGNPRRRSRLGPAPVASSRRAAADQRCSFDIVQIHQLTLAPPVPSQARFLSVSPAISISISTFSQLVSRAIPPRPPPQTSLLLNNTFR